MTAAVAVMLGIPASISLHAAEGPVEIIDLKCNMQHNPYGIADPVPSLSWKLVSDRDNVVQKAYRIQVASSEAALESGDADKWDSGWR